MGKNIMQWKTKGMNRDTSVSAFNAEFAFENVNMRLATNEGNTMMSWVNERGTEEIRITGITEAWETTDAETSSKYHAPAKKQAIQGITIGTAVLNHQLVLFTTMTTDDSTVSDGVLPDRIYVFKYNDNSKTSVSGKLLYEGNLNFHVKYPLETMVYFEADYIQKVYWTDNRNQPRLINIASTDDKITRWHTGKNEQDFFFDFVPTFEPMQEDTVLIELNNSGGLFSPGVIQYAFTYINKYGQETNLVYVSTLYYLAHKDRGAAADGKVSSSFNITIQDIDSNFDYLRIYSIQRTSLDATPFVRQLIDLSIYSTNADGNLTYIDTGTNGSSMDPTELLYKGGREIKALTMASKDNTLFIGNITQKNTLVDSIQDYFDSIRGTENKLDLNFTIDSLDTVGIKTFQMDDPSNKTYSHTNTLNKNLREISTFKGGETYRLGFQLQKKTGDWSEPIFIDDVTNEHYPKTGITNIRINLPYAKTQVDISKIAEAFNSSSEEDFYSVYQAIRPIIVYPTINDRNVLCQGVLNPTVFNAVDRYENAPFAQPSWFFRPYCFTEEAEIWDSTYKIDSDFGISTEREVPVPSNANVLIGLSISDSSLKRSNWNYIVGDVDTIALETIAKNGYLTTQVERNFEYSGGTVNTGGTIEEHINFKYIIPLETYNKEKSTIKCAFLRSVARVFPKECNYENTSWVGIDNDNVSYTGTYKLKYDNLINVEYPPLIKDSAGDYFTGQAFFTTSVDSVKNVNIPYYYRPNNDAPKNYIFKFYTDTAFYTVVFKDMGKLETVKVNSSGYILPFGHYESLVTIDDDNYYREEIEGSKKLSDSAFDALPYNITGKEEEDWFGKKSISANNQFYIDQSILTLNSPELEFDSDIQTFSYENIHFRIIGIVPITGYSMAHRITTSSSMLPSAYNSDTEYAGYYGSGELQGKDITHINISSYGGHRFIADYIWEDTVLVPNADKNNGIEGLGLTSHMVFPWRRNGSMTSDTREEAAASSWLKTKKMSHNLYSVNSVYDIVDGNESFDYPDIDTAIHLTENSYIYNISLPRQYTEDNDTDITYYPNIDRVLTNTYNSGYLINGKDYYDDVKVYSTAPVSMKYKSSSHIVIALKSDDEGIIPIMPKALVETSSDSKAVIGEYDKTVGSKKAYETFWGDVMQFSQKTFDATAIFEVTKKAFDFLYLGELYKDVNDLTRFGGTSKSALLANDWQVGGAAITFENINENKVDLTWTEGDTYYQRYDCIKTYPFTDEDTNQNTEILSFMCETHVNIDGRYDQNRGQKNSYNMKPGVNFNMLNTVYSQRNNFFISKKTDTEGAEKELSYPNHIYYSKTKESGADVDLWTNVTLATTLELDGDKGKITSLNRLNNQLFAFQDSGISQILYNENVQISSTEGVPIELANSGKVQGKRYLSDTIGCSNKWSITQTPMGIYFMDSNDKGIYLFNGQLSNLSTSGGFNSWAKQTIPSTENEWDPHDFGAFVTYYDKLNQDVLFINSERALAYSEKLGGFTSFYDYGEVPYFENFDDTGVWVQSIDNQSKLWKHQAGDYCKFFGNNKPYSMTLIANQNPQTDKIFTNLELRACVADRDYSWDNIEKKFPEGYQVKLPFDKLDVWNDYQHGILNLTKDRKFTHATADKISSLTRKFRIWRCDLPRDNAPVDAAEDATLGTIRYKPKPLDRIRNMWAYIKLEKKAASFGDSLPKTEIHDITATYFS